MNTKYKVVSYFCDIYHTPTSFPAKKDPYNQNNIFIKYEITAVKRKNILEDILDNIYLDMV